MKNKLTYLYPLFNYLLWFVLFVVFVFITLFTIDNIVAIIIITILSVFLSAWVEERLLSRFVNRLVSYVIDKKMSKNNTKQ